MDGEKERRKKNKKKIYLIQSKGRSMGMLKRFGGEVAMLYLYWL